MVLNSSVHIIFNENKNTVVTYRYSDLR
jgi:hypothetical protein